MEAAAEFLLYTCCVTHLYLQYIIQHFYIVTLGIAKGYSAIIERRHQQFVMNSEERIFIFSFIHVCVKSN